MKIINIALAAALLCTGSLYAQKPEHAGKGKKEKKHKKHHKHNKHFSSQEKEQIQAYYSSLPYGQQKKLRRTGSLPPGWQDKVNIGETVPREYINVAQPVPHDLEIMLNLQPNSKLLQISNKILRVEIGTNRLLGEIQF